MFRELFYQFSGAVNFWYSELITMKTTSICLPCNDDAETEGNNNRSNLLLLPSRGSFEIDMRSKGNDVNLNNELSVLLDSSSSSSHVGLDDSDDLSTDSLLGSSNTKNREIKEDFPSETVTLQKSIRSTADLLENWKSELHLDVYVYDQFRPKYNILEAIESNKLLLPYIYFDPMQYPSHDGFDGEGWRNLLRHLERESYKEGFCIHSNGYGNGCSNQYRRLVCKHGILYRNSLKDRKCISNYRKNGIKNDRLHSRGSSGKKMARRSRTSRPIAKEKLCPFYFHISYDNKGFFIRNGFGCCCHKQHPKVNTSKYNYPVRLLSDEEKRIAKSVIDANANKGIVRNLIAKRTGQTVSLNACHYLGTLGNDLKRMSSLEGLSSSDKIIKFFHEKQFDYIILYNSTVSDFKPETVDLVNDNFISSNSLFTNTMFILPPNEQVDAKNYALDNRCNCKLRSDQNLLIALAWVVPEERRMFELFPETLFVDSTEDTNNEGRPLFTMGGCTSEGKMFTFLRAFLPNQRSWAFRWLFIHVLPTMFSKNIYQKIRVIISDGDSQEFHQIDTAIIAFSPSIHRIRCGWHVLDRGWERHGPSSRDYENKVAYREISSIVKNWMYSWCSSSAETEEEHLVSKALFEQFVYSDRVMKTLGTSYSKKVLNFFRLYVEPILPYMVFYKRKHIRHFDYYSNVKLESTYSGIKTGSTPVTPGTALHNSVALLSNIAERNSGKHHKANTYDVLSKKTWVSLSCADEVNLRCEQILTNQWSRRKSYISFRTGIQEWLVFHNDETQTTNNGEKAVDLERLKSIYPIFRRVRKVSVSKNTNFVCSCSMFERFGIPCRHTLSVLDSFPSYKEPSVNDCSVIYWKIYAMYGRINSDNISIKRLSNMLQKLRDNDVLGPSCPKSFYENIPVCTELPERFRTRNLNELNCLNYNIKHVLPLKHYNVYAPAGYGVSMSLSQNDIDTDETHELKDDINQSFNENLNQREECLNNNFMKTLRTKKDAYGELIPVFKELVSHLQNNDISHMNRVKSLLMRELNDMKKLEVSDINTPKGNIVSSTSNFVKKRKTHGTKYYRK